MPHVQVLRFGRQMQVWTEQTYVNLASTFPSLMSLTLASSCTAAVQLVSRLPLLEEIEWPTVSNDDGLGIDLASSCSQLRALILWRTTRTTCLRSPRSLPSSAFLCLPASPSMRACCARRTASHCLPRPRLCACLRCDAYSCDQLARSSGTWRHRPTRRCASSCCHRPSTAGQSAEASRASGTQESEAIRGGAEMGHPTAGGGGC